MRRRFWFFCFFLLSISILSATAAKADMIVPTWGEAIQNDCYSDIEIQGESIIIHQRIEMRLKKLVTDDYLYTFTTNSAYGKFDESSLFITAPSTGLKDSVFDHGCKLEYLSMIALEETLEVTFEYEYLYARQDIGEVLYKGWVGGHVIDQNKSIQITCNREIEAKVPPDWRTIGKGTDVVYRPRSGGTLWVKICFSAGEKTDELEEQTIFELIPEHRDKIPNLIEEEFITVQFTERDDGAYNYHLYGTIELDIEVAEPFAPFYAWFPNQHTNALVKLETVWDYWGPQIDVLEIEPATLGEQIGFYISIPQLSYLSWLGTRTCDEAVLILEIDGVQTERSCDFILVTAPQELSSVEFKIPERFYFRSCSSPFEHEADYSKNGFNVRMFYGECPTTGIAHVEWSAWPFAEEPFSLFQNYPNPFNQETLIRYSLPWDCAVKLSVYNLLGQQVKTLVDEPQSADDYEVKWEGKNEQGQEVASGVYFFRIDIGELIDTKKMVILR